MTAESDQATATSSGPGLPLQVGAKVRIDAHHPTMPAAGAVKRNHGRGGTVVQSYGQGYADDRPRLVDLDDDRGTVLVNTLYLRELVPAPPDALIVRWQQLDEDQREQVVEFLAKRRTDVFAGALAFEERTRPDD